jgi:transcriptional regulator
MYLPAHFEEARPEVLFEFLRDHPLATLVIAGSAGLSADHVPLLARADGTALGRLVGHVARANPLWREAKEGIDCLLIFTGCDHYISPGWYATKAETGQVVPTWNYEVVHARGRLRAVDDPVWLRQLLVELTREHEAGLPRPWTLDEAPPDHIAQKLQAIVGLEIELHNLAGKLKASQNQPRANQQSVVEALHQRGDAAALAMARAIRRHLPEEL